MTLDLGLFPLVLFFATTRAFNLSGVYMMLMINLGALFSFHNSDCFATVVVLLYSKTCDCECFVGVNSP